ncbi:MULTISPECIES: hypothetical protein [unclassified Agarivorans]|uniref:hypothetical protein n=1 Tax=unclassified Agarivorans TaxID=2636026 RepID=UPI0026E28A14|nr:MULTISPECIES: hypothetical protein [unclassified Agarivorans]MDO6685007.1 hypothetical protein [Agarivorans sp. 3_MG-2023]MDO6717435.1 hypothetical protein [Agarivorans sp. 2_MG-2023]
MQKNGESCEVGIKRRNILSKYFVLTSNSVMSQDILVEEFGNYSYKITSNGIVTSTISISCGFKIFGKEFVVSPNSKLFVVKSSDGDFIEIEPLENDKWFTFTTKLTVRLSNDDVVMVNYRGGWLNNEGLHIECAQFCNNKEPEYLADILTLCLAFIHRYDSQTD